MLLRSVGCGAKSRGSTPRLVPDVRELWKRSSSAVVAMGVPRFARDDRRHGNDKHRKAGCAQVNLGG
jgi:hypothetical protein